MVRPATLALARTVSRTCSHNSAAPPQGPPPTSLSKVLYRLADASPALRPISDERTEESVALSYPVLKHFPLIEWSVRLIDTAITSCYNCGSAECSEPSTFLLYSARCCCGSSLSSAMIPDTILPTLFYDLPIRGHFIVYTEGPQLLLGLKASSVSILLQTESNVPLPPQDSDCHTGFPIHLSCVSGQPRTIGCF